MAVRTSEPDGTAWSAITGDCTVERAGVISHFLMSGISGLRVLPDAQPSETFQCEPFGNSHLSEFQRDR